MREREYGLPWRAQERGCTDFFNNPLLDQIHDLNGVKTTSNGAWNHWILVMMNSPRSLGDFPRSMALSPAQFKSSQIEGVTAAQLQWPGYPNFDTKLHRTGAYPVLA